MKERAGYIMDYKTTDAVTAGVPIIVGTQVGIPNITVAKSDEPKLLALTTAGVFELPKDTGAIEQGAKVYLTSAKHIVATAEGNTYAGVAWSPAEEADTTVMVKINA
ncbi:DUF2190 family protein [Acidaminococcus massiliensis]|jgi:predicted RecA/RadA family phage recombinase|uniref:DUF2190 family protein n=1 Tax=Acidaminococcus massiliensis TaxID=1852375 RepID=UPI00206B32EF|nr:DUF2190 family protein [Acidaminococcus massiliensis]DAR24846.1 MAG TPA: protein of unknown function DUF2190 [Caudoviricetes sp.]